MNNITKHHFLFTLFTGFILFIYSPAYAGCNDMDAITYSLDLEKQYKEAFSAGDFNRINELKAQRMSRASASENCNEQLQTSPATVSTDSTPSTTTDPATSPTLMEAPPWLSSSPDTNATNSTAPAPPGTADSTTLAVPATQEELSKNENTASADSLPTSIETTSPVVMEPPPWLSSTPDTSATNSTAPAPPGTTVSTTIAVPDEQEELSKNENTNSTSSLPGLMNTPTPILMEPPSLTSVAPSSTTPTANPQTPPTSIPSTFDQDKRTKAELWQDAKDQLNTRRTSPTLDANEFVEYVEQIESQYPDATWQQIVAALHAEGYGNDINGSTMPLFDGSITGIPWNKFIQGPETDGYEDISNHLSVASGRNYRDGRITYHTPKNVIGPDGRRIDIQHSYAGLRSDLNRGDLWDVGNIRSDFMRWTQTDGGDSYQEIIYAPEASWNAGTPSWSTAHAPPNQRAGNALGVWLSDFYRNPKNKNIPLSQAYKHFFESDIKIK